MRRWSHEQEIKSISHDVRERSVRMVQEHVGEYATLCAGVEAIAPKIGSVRQALHDKQEIDTGLRDDVTSEERERINVLERENKNCAEPT